MGPTSRPTYALVADDEGKTVKVQVSFTDDAGNDETLTSTATLTAAPTPNTPVTGAPTIRGTTQVAETLTADTSGIGDADGLENVAFSYHWLAASANCGPRTLSRLPWARSLASWRKGHRWQSAARLSSPQASGRLSYTWAVVSWLPSCMYWSRPQ